MRCKSDVREFNKTKRSGMEKEVVKEKSESISKFFLSSEFYKNAGCIMLYLPLGNEVDLTKIIIAAFADNKKVILPVTNETTGEITPCEITKVTEYLVGAFGVTEPQNAKKADESEIDVVVVPGIAFDKKGARVGFGKGCYDSFLKNVSATKIGVCYDFQLCDDIEVQEHDICMDCIITEKGTFLI